MIENLTDTNIRDSSIQSFSLTDTANSEPNKDKCYVSIRTSQQKYLPYALWEWKLFKKGRNLYGKYYYAILKTDGIS